MMTVSEKGMPMVSVVTVCKDAAPLLRRTLESVNRQDYEPMEMVVVDGASEDGTLDLLQQEWPALTQWVSEHDGGIYDAMNKGVGLSEGEWIIFLNAGDTFAADDVLQRIFATPRDGADILYGDVVKDGVVHRAPAHYRLYHRMLFCHQSALTRRELLIDSPFDTRHRLSADLKFFLTQALRGAAFSYVGFPVANFDTTGVSNSHRSAGLRDNLRVVREVIPWPQRLGMQLRLLVPYISCKLRGK